MSRTKEEGLELTLFEQEAFEELYSSLQKDAHGNVGGQDVSDLLKSSLLPTVTLKEIWDFVDSNGSGRLSKNQFFKCLRLIAHAQDKKPISLDTLNEPGTLPRFRRTTKPTSISTNPQQQPQQQAFGAEMIITQEDKERYKQMFNELQPTNGNLSGEKAKSFLLQSQLPHPVLSSIWKLADLNGDGSLSFDEFCIAVFLVSWKTNGYELPSTLPKSLLNSVSNINTFNPKDPSAMRQSSLSEFPSAYSQVLLDDKLASPVNSEHSTRSRSPSYSETSSIKGPETPRSPDKTPTIPILPQPISSTRRSHSRSSSVDIKKQDRISGSTPMNSYLTDLGIPTISENSSFTEPTIKSLSQEIIELRSDQKKILSQLQLEKQARIQLQQEVASLKSIIDELRNK